mmetsp:Transcript_8784/g.20951  ORF Transcript_8784/g.20951 Transcript_8784/m.20951 type:complete len:158 (+) Transcript_8784:174-647(+)
MLQYINQFIQSRRENYFRNIIYPSSGRPCRYNISFKSNNPDKTLFLFSQSSMHIIMYRYGPEHQNNRKQIHSKYVSISREFIDEYCRSDNIDLIVLQKTIHALKVCTALSRTTIKILDFELIFTRDSCRLDFFGNRFVIQWRDTTSSSVVFELIFGQ